MGTAEEITNHTWKNRGVEQYQCKNHRTDGKLTCTNDFADKRNLERAFVQAYNNLLESADHNKWKRMAEEGTPLQKIRGKQMIELAEAGQLTTFVPELAQLVLIEVTVHGAKSFEFEFMDGSNIKAML